MINSMFNKINKNESERALLCIDNVNKLMPTVSRLLFETEIGPKRLFTHFALHKNERKNEGKDDKDDGHKAVDVAQAMPVIRDAFMTYNQGAKMFTLSDDFTKISSLLFNPRDSSLFVDDNYHNCGLVQEFNILIRDILTICTMSRVERFIRRHLQHSLEVH